MARTYRAYTLAWLAYGLTLYGYLCVVKDEIWILLSNWVYLYNQILDILHREGDVSLVDKLVCCHQVAMVAMLVNVSCYGCHVMCAIDENIGDECFVSQNTYTLQKL